MRLRSIRAANVLSFTDLSVYLSNSDVPTVFVGPNGSGKTNLFRAVRQMIAGLAVTEFTAEQERWNQWRELLDSWVRDRSKVAIMELGIDWNDDNEQRLLTDFFRMVLVNPSAIAHALKNVPTGFEGRVAWARWVDSVERIVPEDQMNWLFSGILGIQYQPSTEVVTVYYRPMTAHDDWVILLHPESGVTSSVPAEQWRSWSSPALASVWLSTVAQEDRDHLRMYLQTDGVPATDVPRAAFVWTHVLRCFFEDHPPALSTNRLLPLMIEPVGGRPVPAPVAQLYRELRVRQPAQQTLTLQRLFVHLLEERVVCSDDLLSPPETGYDPGTWRNFAKQFTSRHLGAHLLGLKLGDDSERERFSAIQETFRQLSGRELDVTVPHATGGSDKADVTVVQKGAGDLRSVPLAISGSGLVELAYVSTLLHAPRSHAVLLDEPGRSLHPQALIRLRRFLYGRPQAQILLITHSPYLVEPQHLGDVCRVWRDPSAGTCKACIGDQHFGTALAQRNDAQRQDRWGRSPNWPSLLFATAVLLVDGETELASLPIWYRAWYGEPLEAVGATILSCSGKRSNGSAMADLDAWHIPWVALVDGDSLACEAGNIWDELAKARRIRNEQAKKAKAESFDIQKQKLQTEFGIYVAGGAIDEKFESVLMKEIEDGAATPTQHGRKVLRAIDSAQQSPCPPSFIPVFEAVRNVAMSGLNPT